MELKNRFHLTYCEEYGMWLTLMRACYNPKSSDYKNFGAKGLYLPKTWQKFSSFIHSANFRGDSTEKPHMIYLDNNSEPYPDGRPKKLGPKGNTFYRISFEEIRRKKQERADCKLNQAWWEKLNLAEGELKKVFNRYCQRFYTFVKRLDYEFDSEWLFSFDDPEKLKFLLKYSRKSYDTVPVDDMEYYVDFVNHFYYDEQFNKVYDNWRQSDKDGRISPALDHIHPKSKGGPHDLENLRFVTTLENYFKGTRSLEEWEYIKNNPEKFFI